MNEHASGRSGKENFASGFAELFEQGLVWGLILQVLPRALIAWLGYEIMTRITFSRASSGQPLLASFVGSLGAAGLTKCQLLE
jgi:uncharacterized membrane protein